MKLTLVSIVIHGRRHSAFVQLGHGQNMTEEKLCSIFPALKKMARGHTYSIG